MLPKKFDMDTASGVLLVIKRRGMTGYGATYFSTATNITPDTALLVSKPQING